MRRATWLAILGAVCIGCGVKQAPQADVVIDPGEPKVVVPADPSLGKVAALDYHKLWLPKDPAAVDPKELVNQLLAQKHFAEHHPKFLAAATCGTAANIPQGGMHGVVAPAALAIAYPDVAKRMEQRWKDGLKISIPLNMPVMDYSTSGTGRTSNRVLVFRVKDGTDDELRIRFGEYLTRVEAAVKSTGVTLVVHQRGGLRMTGSLSDIRYETPKLEGYARSVVIRKYEESDVDFTSMMLADLGDEADLVKGVLKGDRGPYLVVAIREQRR